MFPSSGTSQGEPHCGSPYLHAFHALRGIGLTLYCVPRSTGPFPDETHPIDTDTASMDKKHLHHDAVILVCTRKDGRCFKKGAKLRARLRNELELRGLTKRVKVVPAGCLGACGKGPVVMTPRDATLWTAVKKTDVADLVAAVAATLPPTGKDDS